MAIDSDFWAQRRVLVTGHSGFKGAWLSLWLQSLGAAVCGVADGPPTRPSLYELAAVGSGMREYGADVRDPAAVRAALAGADPEIVFHLAAQPIVRRALRDPVATFEINVLGTVNVLDAVRTAGGVRAVVVVTSDKCYANPAPADPGAGDAVGTLAVAAGARARRFAEEDRLGGNDPYSSSKACAELVTAAYRSSYFGGEDAPAVASARAGNVIGGGDWGEDRLLADAVRAVQAGDTLRVRNPRAVRPWQHVLNPLSGYLLLAQRLFGGAATARPQAARAWNFGPPERDERTVGWVVERLGALWDGALSWQFDTAEHPPEASRLALDSSAAGRFLGWRPGWGLEEALARVVQWHTAERAGADMRLFTLQQIADFA